jgi:hypothetical protein
MTTQTFFSYARHDGEAAATIASGLQQLGQSVWIDKQLSGGQQWWNTILGQIRDCDVFVFVLSNSSLRSKACRAELEYAHQLGRTILPVAVHPVIDQLLPPYLAETQRVDGADIVQLARALLALPAPPSLPDPLPEPPPVPLSYLDEVADSLDRHELPIPDQRNLLGALKQLVRDDEERDAAVELLRRLRRHPQVTAFVAEEIDTELARLYPPADSARPQDEGQAQPQRQGQAPPQGHPQGPGPTQGQGQQPSQGHRPETPPRPPDPPPPVRRPPHPPHRDEPHRRRSGRGLVVAGLLVVALAGGGAAVAATMGNDEGSGTGPTPSPTTGPEPTDPPVDETTTTSEEVIEPSLRDLCGSGDMVACDELFFDSEIGSDDETFGSFCGGLSSEPLSGFCEETFG